MNIESSVTEEEHLFRVHAICRYMRPYVDEKPCERCPLTFESVENGTCKQGCVGLAEEVINIAVHGNPWGPDHNPEGVEKWRKRFNKV